MQIPISRIDPRAVIPEYSTIGSAAFDLTVIEDVTIDPLANALLRTGLVFRIPEDHALLLFARSSTYKKFNVILANGVGMIDPDYCGPEDEVKISVLNPTAVPQTIRAGSRVAQGMIIPRPRITFEEQEISGINRGGFGTTGGHNDVGV